MRAWLLRGATVAVAAAVGTITFGWWTLPVIGAVRGVLPGRDRLRWVEAAAGAGLGWAALLAWAASRGPAADLSARVAAVFGLPAAALWMVTILFAALLAGSAAILTGGLRR